MDFLGGAVSGQDHSILFLRNTNFRENKAQLHNEVNDPNYLLGESVFSDVNFVNIVVSYDNFPKVTFPKSFV